jgi:hypothetical protein
VGGGVQPLLRSNLGGGVKLLLQFVTMGERGLKKPLKSRYIIYERRPGHSLISTKDVPEGENLSSVVGRFATFSLK